MKKTYTSPIVAITEFENEDIITASGLKTSLTANGSNAGGFAEVDGLSIQY